MKRVVAVVAIAILLIPSVFAQLDWSVTDLRCGDGVLDKYELCEKDVEESRCDQLAEKLGIAMGCYEDHCTCVPKVNPVYCGNGRRDFNEMCDGDAEDVCDVLGEIMGNITLTCNKDTCGCDFAAVPDGYSPTYLEELSNASTTPSSCGDKKVERDEDCDPPNTLCTIGTDEPGVCNEKCKCVKPEAFGAPEETVEEKTTETTENVTEENVTEPAVKDIVEVIPEEQVEEKKPGFFARIWNWITGLFS